MSAFGGGGFLGLTNTLRSLTAASPITTAINEARRQARRHLEAGGTAAPARGRVDDRAGPADFVLPADIEADDVAKAIEAKLRGTRGSPSDRRSRVQHMLERKAGGRVVVSGYHLLRLGDGRFDRGRRFMERIISDIRARRGLTRSRRNRRQHVTTLSAPRRPPAPLTSFLHAR